jgi:hypothetical protein
MIHRAGLFLSTMALLCFTSCVESRPELKNHYPLSPLMVVNETGCGYGIHVADEQYASEPKTTWNGYDKAFCKDLKASLVLNLMQTLHITELYIYSEGANEVSIQAPLDAAAKKEQLKSGWNKITLNVSSSYVRIGLTTQNPLGEILVNADKPYPSITTPKRPQSKVLVEDFIGTNAFVDVPLGLLEPFGCVREYHDWPDWSEPQQDSFHIANSPQGFDFEFFYQNLQKQGKLVVPVLQKSPKWLTQMTNAESKPLKTNTPADNPASYERHSLFLSKYSSFFQNPARGNVSYFENWNEPDKWWEHDVSYFTPYQYASMTSADKDGHLGTLQGISGMGNAKLVMAGLANPKIDYLHALKFWCDQYRKGHFAWDVINLHRYSNSAGAADNTPQAGICPEKARLYEEMTDIVRFRDLHTPKAEIWMTEFGYDTQKSPQQCAAIGDKNSELVQADWLIRSYLLLYAAGVDKAFQFMIRDFGKEGLYATCGLYATTSKTEARLKPAWNYINTLKGALQGSYLSAISLDTLSGLYKMTLKNAQDPLLTTTVLWLGSQENKEMEYDLGENDRLKTKIIRLSPHSPNGDASLSGQNRKIIITETPLFIQQHPEGKYPTAYYLQKVQSTQMKTSSSDGISDKILLDEQTKNDPLFGLNMSNPTTFWKSTSKPNANEEVVFSFPKKKYIHSLQLFDGAGTGEISIFAKKDKTWQLITTVKMNLYNKWKTCILNVETEEIKIQKSKQLPDIGEALYYEKIFY